LREQACALRALLRAHPNALPIIATRPAVTPASIARVESALEILGSAGFSPGDALSCFQVLTAFVVGHTLAAYSRPEPGEASVPDYQRLSEQQFPRVREASRLLASHDLEAEFELGLDALLLGLEPLLGGRSRRGLAKKKRA
jgi:hypothetical protein